MCIVEGKRKKRGSDREKKRDRIAKEKERETDTKRKRERDAKEKDREREILFVQKILLHTDKTSWTYISHVASICAYVCVLISKPCLK